MVSDLNMPVKIRVMPTIREKGGLALSSRNTYLCHNERNDALVLSEALNLAKDLTKNGKSGAAIITKELSRFIREKKTARIDYVAVVDAETLEPVKRVEGKCLVALAVWIGRTRLIDNVMIRLPAGR